MRQYLLILPIIALFFSLPGCKPAQQIERPAERYEDRQNREVSVLSVPVRLDVANFERSLNRRLTGLLYEDKDMNDGDNMLMRATKQSDIRLRIDSQQITYRVPMNLWIKYDAGITDLEATGDISVDLRTTFQVRPNWQIETQTELVNHDWIRKPRLQMGVVNLPIGLVADLVIRNSRKTLTRNIDQMVRESFDLKSVVEQVWQQMYQPIQVSEEYGAWLIVNPQRLGMTALRAENNIVSSTIVVESRPEIKLGGRPSNRVPGSLPGLVFITPEAARDSFVVHLDTEIPYEEAERLARDQIVGQTYSSGKRSVKVEGIEIFGSGRKLVVNTTLSGSYRGNIYLEGEPFYNSRTNTVEVRDLEFTLSTKNVLYKSAGWLLKSTIRRQIQENLQFLLDTNLSDMKNQLQQQLGNYRVMEDIQLSGQLQELNIRNVFLTPQSIVVDVGLMGRVNLLVKGLN